MDNASITSFLKKNDIDQVGNLLQDPSDQDKYYAFVKIARDPDGRQYPSNFKLNKISAQLNSKGVELSFVLIEDENQDLQASVKTALFRLFPELVRNAFASLHDEKITVWVEPKVALNRVQKTNIEKTIVSFLAFINVKLEAVHFTSSENIPTMTACLNVIRLKSPIKIENISDELLVRGFHIPNIKWLSKLLDKSRKSGLIIRKKDESFALTLSGLKALGSEKHRSSPDIRRALEIANPYYS